MALPYNLWTEEEVKNRGVVPPGVYNFEVVNAEQKPTKGGVDKDGNLKKIHEMLEVEFNFWNGNGVVLKLKDWIVFMEKMDWKLRHLCSSVGLLNLYESHTLESQDLKGRKGSFILGEKKMVNEIGEQKKVNFVKDYVKRELEQIVDLNDDISF